ncbi:hypothetical protein SUDANB2_07164 [Streptomyces sp. enrichment culture]
MRLASMADVEPVAELRAVVLRTDLERLGRYDEQRVRQRLREGFTPAHTWVTEVRGLFAGSVSLRPAEDAHWLEHSTWLRICRAVVSVRRCCVSCWSGLTATAPGCG